MASVQTTAVLQLVVDTLLAQSSIQALVSNRVRGSFERSSDEQTVIAPKIVVQVESGGRLWYGGSPAEMTVAIHVLSDVGQDEALSIYEVAHEVLHGAELCHATNGHRGTMSEIQRPVAGWVDKAACWWATGRYRLVAVR
jgi:hypothetical protein